MTVRTIINRMTNGEAHLMLISDDTGEIILKTIWYNEIPEKYLDCTVTHITIKDYEMRLTINE